MSEERCESGDTYRPRALDLIGFVKLFDAPLR